MSTDAIPPALADRWPTLDESAAKKLLTRCGWTMCVPLFMWLISLLMFRSAESSVSDLVGIAAIAILAASLATTIYFYVCLWRLAAGLRRNPLLWVAATFAGSMILAFVAWIIAWARMREIIHRTYPLPNPATCPERYLFG